MTVKRSTIIRTLNGFLRWASQFDSEDFSDKYLFRGVSSKEYEISASAYRRPKKSDRNFEIFLQINRGLIREARFRGHDQRNGRKLEDLEVLAELQHYGAATCLIDFTYNALVALWFACKQNSKGSPRHGKVVALRNESSKFKEITLELLREKIDYFFPNNEDRRLQLYQWQPRQQNNRIIAQQSIFLFGDVKINIDGECFIARSSKEKIRESLNQVYGITEAMLFPDFDGFARQHSQDVLYTQLTASQYRERGSRAHQRGEYAAALADYAEAIHLNPNDAQVYSEQGLVRMKLQQPEAALADFNRQST